MRHARLWTLVACLSAASGAAWAHHSYAMFDTSGTKTVSGTVAKLEWMNPHAFLWVYVPSADKAGKYDLWEFENGSPSVLQGYRLEQRRAQGRRQDRRGILAAAGTAASAGTARR